MPKKPRIGQNKAQKKKGGTSKTGVQIGKKTNTQKPQVQQKQAEAAQGTAPSPNSKKPGGNKRPTMQIVGARKKSKAQRTPPDYTITYDDGEMIAQMVHDSLSKDFDHVAHHRNRIEEQLEDMWKLLKKIREGKTTRSNRTKPSTPQMEERVEVEE